MRAGIYLIRCQENNSVYVGQSQNVRERFSQHRCKLRRGQHDNPHLQAAWQKYGEESFGFEPHVWEDDPILRSQAEETLLAQLRQQGVRLFNIRPSAATSKGVKFTRATRAKISRKAQEQFSTPEKREAHSLSYRRDATSYTLTSDQGSSYTFINPSEFAREHHLGLGSLHKLLKGQLFSYLGWTNPKIDTSGKKSSKLTLAQKREAIERFVGGETSPSIAASYGVTPSAMTGLLKRAGATGGVKKLRDDRTRAAKDMREAGWSAASLAAHFGVHQTTVHRWLTT